MQDRTENKILMYLKAADDDDDDDEEDVFGAAAFNLF
jgi:hypothetical protein